MKSNLSQTPNIRVISLRHMKPSDPNIKTRMTLLLLSGLINFITGSLNVEVRWPKVQDYFQMNYIPLTA